MTTGIPCAATTGETVCEQDAISIRNGLLVCREHRDTARPAALPTP